MTTKTALENTIKTVKFDINLAIQINDREYYEGYTEVEKKLQEAMELVKKYNLI